MSGDRLAMTPQKAAIIDAIHFFYEDHGYQPTIREIGEIVGLSSTDTIHTHLTNLREMGLVDWVNGQVRTLHIVSEIQSGEKAA